MLALKAVNVNEDGTYKEETCIEVKGLFSACTSFEFIMSLVLAQKRLSCTWNQLLGDSRQQRWKS